MPLAMFRGETSIEALATRLFRLRSGNSQAGRQATEALLRANPQLANLERVPPGSVIVVPDTAAAVNAGETVQPAAFTLTDSAGLLAEHVAAFASALAAQTADAAAQANSTLKLVRDRSLATAAGKDQDLAQRLTAISDNTKTTLADLQAQQATLKQALAQLQEDLAKFTNASLPPAQPVPKPPAMGPAQPPSPARTHSDAGPATQPTPPPATRTKKKPATRTKKKK